MAELQTLGRYKLQRRIASSATGEVYEALDPRLDRPLAIKTILKSYFGEEGEVAFVVMALIRGRDLKHCFDSDVRFEPKEIVRIMCELLGALDYAHRSGIVHRDIKPSNVLLDAEGRVKLTMDFAVARLIDVERTGRTQAGAMAGPASYMSPEQVQGLAADHRSDLFSSGLVLYQLLTNRQPFAGGGVTLLKKIVHDDP